MKTGMYENKSYIEHFKNLSSPLRVLDEKSRNIKSEKIISVINDFSRRNKLDTKQLNCLDVGCSGGLITVNLSNHFKSVVGLDTDKNAISLAEKKYNKKNLNFVIGSGLNIPYEDESFDVIICNQVYEHVPDYKKLFLEIHRVLKKGGFCYLSAVNKYVLIEVHYHLPFLSWLPQSLANLYLRITKRGDIYEEKCKSYYQIIKAINRFEIKDYTVDIMKDPNRYCATDMINPKGLVPKIPTSIYNLFRPLLPVYIFIIKKY